MKLSYNDAQHAYWLDGKRCKSVTTVAKIPEDTYRLERWQQRQVAIGLATDMQAAIESGTRQLSKRITVLEKIAAEIGNDSKINMYCDEAAALAGAHEGRDRGNVLHTALEAHDLGKRFIPTDLTSAAIIGWEQICESMGWTVELVERCVVWPDQLIAGRFDRIVKDRDGSRFIVDFKGGAKVVNYPHAIACQLALYANAPLLAGPIPGDGGSTEEFEKLEGIDAETAYVVHLPPDGDAQLIQINIYDALGVVLHVIFPTIEWRNKKGLAKIVELPGVSAITNDTDPFAGLPNETNAPVLNPHREPKPIDPLDIRHGNIGARLIYLKQEHPQMAQVVASRWPEGVPNIKMPLTGEDLDRIEAVLIDAERAVEAPFDPVQVATDEDVRVGLQAALDKLGFSFDELAIQAKHNRFYNDLARRTWLAYGQISAVEETSPPASPAHGEPPLPGTPVDEGPDMELADIAAFKGTFADLELTEQQRIDAWAAQAHEAGVSISMRDRPSKRRFSIGRFLLIASHHHEDVVRAALALAIGDDEIQPVITTGSVLGVLTQPEAERAWEILLAVDGAQWSIRQGSRWPRE